MIKSSGKYALLALGAVPIPAPAQSVAFSAAYTCSVPVAGNRPVTITGTLAASPNRPAAGRPVHFQLHISSLSLRSPVAIDSWSAAAGIDVEGAQTGSFRLSGFGGAVAPRQPVSGDLRGRWTPPARGTYRLRGGRVTIRAKIAMLATATVPCVPYGVRPVLASLTVGGV